jgi:hypothetical protein
MMQRTANFPANFAAQQIPKFANWLINFYISRM